ncbi:hypothetical protein AB3R30_02665 [Leptolyngbyaceae cyanobacterium UHCC 1019]
MANSFRFKLASTTAIFKVASREQCSKAHSPSQQAIHNKKKWLEVTAFAVVGTATLINPQAGVLLFLLRLCFHVLAALQREDSDQEDKTDYK